MATFVAIDFETADHGRDSACAVACVLVRNGRIARRLYSLIRPPRRQFFFTFVHGLTWEDVAHSPRFGDLWPRLGSFLDEGDFLVAHNAPFDRGVLRECCAAARLPAPSHRFVCTVQLARRTWGLRRANLPTVCRHLGIPLKHHDALSDAEASARIALAAARDGAVL